MSQALIVRDDAKLTVSLTDEAFALREQALASSALIAKVTNEDENAAAVAAQLALKALDNLAEKARKQAKAPVLEMGKAIDSTIQGFLAPIRTELMRISKPVGDYQALLEARRRAEEAAKRAELDRIERERQAALAAAQTHEAVEKVQEEFNQRARELPPPPPVERPKGQVVKEDWEIIVTDIWALVRAHPMCVKVEPRMSEIRALLDAGQKVAGVQAKRITRADVRPGSMKVVEI